MRLLLFKSHIGAYTRKDGTFVAEHEDKRQRKRVDIKSTRSMADAIGKHAQAMGFYVNRVSSSLSDSNYVNISHHPNGEDAEAENFKVRVSDHQLPAKHHWDMGVADVEISPEGHEHEDTHSTDWKHALYKLHEKTGKELSPSLKKHYAKHLADKKAAEEYANQKRAAAFSAEDVKLEAHRKFATWLDGLPEDAVVRVSKKGNVSAVVNGAEVSAYGAKPAGMQSGERSLSDAKSSTGRDLEFMERMSSLRKPLTKSLRYLIFSSPHTPEA